MRATTATGVSVSRLDRFILDEYVAPGTLPGAQIAIWHQGALVHWQGYGLMDRERGIKVRDDTIFRIRSMTKPVTAVALLMLLEEGRINLRDPVAAYLPSFADLQVYQSGQLGSFVTRPPERPMQVIDLATHTSGLTYEFMSDSPVARAYRTLKIGDRDTPGGSAGMIAQLASLPLEFSPGTRWHYSQATAVLGHLIEVLSGQSLGEFLRQRIFEPLGMADTGFSCPPAKLDRLASLYDGSGPDPLPSLCDDGRHSDFATPARLENGGGGLLSSTQDYLRFCQMLLGAGRLDGARLLGPASVRMLGTNLLPDNRTMPQMGGFPEDAGAGMSISCATTVDPGARLVPCARGDIYWSGAANTHFWVDPAAELAVVFMSQVQNFAHFAAIQDKLRWLVHTDLP